MYDAVPDPVQAIVRAEWDVRIADLIARLDMDAVLGGRSRWSEALPDGTVIVHRGDRTNLG